MYCCKQTNRAFQLGTKIQWLCYNVLYRNNLMTVQCLADFGRMFQCNVWAVMLSIVLHHLFLIILGTFMLSHDFENTVKPSCNKL